MAANADGPPPARTGGFNEATCAECHRGNPVNDALGALAIESLPRTYQPARTYRLTVILARPGIQAAGFQLAVRTHDRRGRQAGELAPLDDRTAFATAAYAPIQYLQHSRKGAGLTAQDTARWTFLWRAPEGLGPVVFHIAANAANGDNSPLDDFIYAREFVLSSTP
jgi:hypothetical protein